MKTKATTQVCHAIPGVVAFVSTHRFGMKTPLLGLVHQHRHRVPLRRPHRLGSLKVHQHPVAVFHQGMGHEDQPGFLAFPFAQQPSLRISGALVGGIVTAFPTEVYPGVARVIIGGLGRVTVPGFKALQAGGRLNQGAVHGEMFVRQQALTVGAQHYLVE